MKELKFDAGYGGIVEIIDRLQHHSLGFAGKPKNHMGYNGYSKEMQLPYCMGKTMQGISASDIIRRFLMDRLQPQFNPDKFFRILYLQIRQEGENLRGRQSGLVAMEIPITSGSSRALR